MDLAVSNNDDQAISVLLGQGDGTFSEHVTYSSGLNPFFILPADLNNDGKIDLAVSNGVGANTVTILFGQGNGKFGNQIMYTVGDGPMSLVAGAFRDKTKLDLIVGNAFNNDISILFNTCP